MENSTKKLWNEWLPKFIFAVLLIAVYFALKNFSQIKDAVSGFLSIISPLLTGILISYLLYVPCKKLEKAYRGAKIKFVSGKARTLSVFSVLALLVLIIVLFVNFAIPVLFNSIADLISNVPGYYDYVAGIIKDIPDDSVFNFLKAERLIELANTYIADWANIENLGKYAKGVAGVLGGIFNILIATVSSVYILLYRGEILKFLNKTAGAFLKEKTHTAIRKYFVKANGVFFKFIASKGLDCVINAVSVSVILLILNVKYALLFGIIAGVFNAIPFFGSAVACFLITVITGFTGGLSKAVTTLILLLIFQQTDANVIEPKIMNSSLKINPLLVIFGVIIGGTYFGVIGMFLAVPVVTVLKAILMDYIEQRQAVKNIAET